MTQSTTHKLVQKLKLSALLLLAVTLTACATHSPPQACACPTPPTAPALSTPLPAVDYSISAQQRIKSWQQSLLATQVMREPSLPPGQ